MNSIELIVATSSVIVALSIAFIVYVLLKPHKEVKKEQVTIEANLEQYDERPALRARITFLEAEIEKFATICDGLTAANKKCLDEFEAYVRLTQGEQEKPVKRSEVNAIDWSVPQAFPEGYSIPSGIKVIKVGEDDEWIRKGSVGTTSECGSNPFIKWENQDFDLHGSGNDWAQYSHNLAPINPTDHPNHPEFKNK